MLSHAQQQRGPHVLPPPVPAPPPVEPEQLKAENFLSTSVLPHEGHFGFSALELKTRTENSHEHLEHLYSNIGICTVLRIKSYIYIEQYRMTMSNICVYVGPVKSAG